MTVRNTIQEEWLVTSASRITTEQTDRDTNTIRGWASSRASLDTFEKSDTSCPCHISKHISTGRPTRSLCIVQWGMLERMELVLEARSL